MIKLNIDIKLFCLVSLGILLLMFPNPSQAQIGCSGPAYCLIHTQTRNEITKYSDEKFKDYEENFVLDELAKDYFTGALQYLTEQITVGDSEVSKSEAVISDARSTAQGVNAARSTIMRQQAALDPSDSVCERATMTTSITASVRDVQDATRRSAAEGSSEDLGTIGTFGSEGPGERLRQQVQRYVEIYADPNDFNGAIVEAFAVTPQDSSRINKDISPFFLDSYTLAFNGNDQSSTKVGQDIKALRLNLFGHDLPRIPSAVADRPEAQDERIDYNRVTQILGLARASYDSITTLRQEGNGEVAPYMAALLKKRGVTEQASIEHILGENNKPSLMAQMKVLTQEIGTGADQGGENMAHSADLARRQITNDALSLMVKFEIYKSLKRQAAHFVVMHELKTDPLSDAVNGSL